MAGNPLTDLAKFLIGDTGDYNRFGPDKYISVAFYLCLLGAAAYVVYLNWSRDPVQRSFKHVSIMLMRVLAGGMWFQGTIWKLPLPVSDGFKYWLGQEVKASALPGQSAIVHDLLLPHLGLLQVPVYLFEIFLTVSLTLGVAVRLSGLLAVLFTLQLWLGLYNDPTEWPWTYVAIILAHGMFAAEGAGRSLGIDHWSRLPSGRYARATTPVARAIRLAA